MSENTTPRAARIVWVITAVISVLIIGLIVGAPVMKARGHLQLASSIYTGFSFLCHQMSDRSFHIAGYQFAVCSRCTGLYAGFAIAALVFPFVHSLKRTEAPLIIWLVLAAVPLAVDFFLGYFAIWANTHVSRFATGALLGAVSVFYILPGLVELSQLRAARVAAKT